jgi:hypothetical protein
MNTFQLALSSPRICDGVGMTGWAGVYRGQATSLCECETVECGGRPGPGTLRAARDV